VENIDNFIEVSDKGISDKLVNEYLHLIDGFAKLPSFLSIFLSNYDDMINQIKKMRISNHIILYQVKPFSMRLGLVPLSYDIVGYQSRIRRRNEKLNQLLNE
jgi:hypothetical protein